MEIEFIRKQNKTTIIIKTNKQEKNRQKITPLKAHRFFFPVSHSFSEVNRSKAKDFK